MGLDGTDVLIRSAESWGVGDYGDLKLLLSDAATKSHADFMLINPIHATAPVPPLEPSPYLPNRVVFSM